MIDLKNMLDGIVDSARDLELSYPAYTSALKQFTKDEREAFSMWMFDLKMSKMVGTSHSHFTFCRGLLASKVHNIAPNTPADVFFNPGNGELLLSFWKDLDRLTLKQLLEIVEEYSKAIDVSVPLEALFAHREQLKKDAKAVEAVEIIYASEEAAYLVSYLFTLFSLFVNVPLSDDHPLAQEKGLPEDPTTEAEELRYLSDQVAHIVLLSTLEIMIGPAILYGDVKKAKFYPLFDRVLSRTPKSRINPVGTSV